MDNLGLIVYALAGAASSVLSGMVGGGGGFIMTPLGIFLGLSPAQAVSTGKLNGLSVTIGALFGMKKIHGRVSKARIIPVMVLALIVGLLSPFAIKAFDSEAYRIALGIILLLMIPILLVKKIGVKPHNPGPVKKTFGGFLLALALALQGIFSGGLGTLVQVVLMGMMGMTALEANLTKRWSQVILNVAIIVGVLGSGLIVWNVALVGVLSTFAGSYFGGRLAVRQGDEFIMRIMIVLIFVSAVGLIISA